METIPRLFKQVILSPEGNSHWNHGCEFYNQPFQEQLAQLAASHQQGYFLFSADKQRFDLVASADHLEGILPVLAQGNVLAHTDPLFI